MPLTNLDKELFEQFKEVIYDALNERINEVKDKAPDVIKLFQHDTSDVGDELDSEIESLMDLDELSYEVCLNIASRFFMLALLMEVAPDTFFEADDN